MAGWLSCIASKIKYSLHSAQIKFLCHALQCAALLYCLLVVLKDSICRSGESQYEGDGTCIANCCWDV